MSLLQSEILHEIINLQEVLSQIIEGLDLQHSILGELSIPGMTAPIPSGATVLSTPAASLPPISSEFKAAKAHREFVEARGKRKKHTENPAMAPKPMVAANLEAVLGVAKLHANLKLRCSDMAIHLQVRDPDCSLARDWLGEGAAAEVD